MLHCEFGLRLLNKVQDMIRNVNIFLLSLKQFSTLRVKATMMAISHLGGGNWGNSSGSHCVNTTSEIHGRRTTNFPLQCRCCINLETKCFYSVYICIYACKIYKRYTHKHSRVHVSFPYMCIIVHNANPWYIGIFEIKLTLEILTVRRQQHSFSTHKRMFFWKCQSFWVRKCLDQRGTWTLNLRIHAECSNQLSYKGQAFAVPLFFNTGSGGIDIF